MVDFAAGAVRCAWIARRPPTGAAGRRWTVPGARPPLTCGDRAPRGASRSRLRSWHHHLADELDLDGLAGLDAVTVLGHERERVDAEHRREDVRVLRLRGAHVPAVVLQGRAAAD